MLNWIDEMVHYTPKWLLLGAYGRTYNELNEAITDFINGKDFLLYQGPYCSIRDWTGEELYIFCSGKFIKMSEEIKKELNG